MVILNQWTKWNDWSFKWLSKTPFVWSLPIRQEILNSSLSSSTVEIWILVMPFLFFRILSGFPNFGPYLRRYMIWSRSRFVFCLSLRGPLTSLGRFFFQWCKKKNCETFPWNWQTSVQIDIPAVVNTFLLQHVQISMRRSGRANVFQWNRECLYTSTREVTLNRPEVGTGFSVIFRFCRLRPSLFALKFSSDIFSPYRLFPDLRKVSNSSELKFFLITMCVDAPEPTTNSRYSGFFEVGARLRVGSRNSWSLLNNLAVPSATGNI